jgi:hypothetical protein
MTILSQTKEMTWLTRRTVRSSPLQPTLLWLKECERLLLATKPALMTIVQTASELALLKKPLLSTKMAGKTTLMSEAPDTEFRGFTHSLRV